MRQPPAKLNARTDHPEDVFNVNIWLKGEKQNGVIWYDKNERKLERYVEAEGRPVIAEGTFKTEEISFEPGDLRVEWIDESKVR